VDIADDDWYEGCLWNERSEERSLAPDTLVKDTVESDTAESDDAVIGLSAAPFAGVSRFKKSRIEQLFKELWEESDE